MQNDSKFHLTLLRHGESEGNIQQLFQGQLDFPLSAQGRKQAQALAERWIAEQVHFDHIIASPLSRAYETAGIIASAFNMPVEKDEGWLEQDFGEMNALSIPEVIRDPSRPRFFTPYNKPGKTGESKMQALIRAGEALHTVLDRPAGRYLIVSHGAILNMAIYNALGLSMHPSSEGPWFAFDNTGFATLSYTPSRHRWQLSGVNDTGHLPTQPAMDLEPGSYHVSFLRHAESEGNANGVWQGRADFPLTATGRSQAQALARRWQAEGQQFDLVIASPLSRARATAETIAQTLHIPLEFEKLWLERDNGRFAGTTPEERQPPEPEYYPLHAPVGNTGETLWEHYLRGGHALHSLLQHPPGRYLVVSHGGILNMTLYAALGVSPLANFQGVRFSFGNAAFATLAYTPARNRWLILGINDQAHLENYRPTP